MLVLFPVAPIGFRKVRVLTCPGAQLREVEEDLYPVSPQGEELRRTRVEANMTLRECARLLGIRPIELGDLESGRAALTVAAWVWVMNQLARASI